MKNISDNYSILIPFYGTYVAIKNIKHLNELELRTHQVASGVFNETKRNTGLKILLGVSAIPVVGTFIWAIALIVDSFETNRIINDYLGQNVKPITRLKLPEYYIYQAGENDCRSMPSAFCFFDIMTSPYKPLGYFEMGRVSDEQWKWLHDKNEEISGNKRHSKKYFYNEPYLTRLLELNQDAFDPLHRLLLRSEIFDENNRVKEGGIQYFIQNHRLAMSHNPKMLGLIHAAFGDSELLRYLDEIEIPDEPGLRDIIYVRDKFPQHTWKNIQTLLRAYNDINLVCDLLKKLPTEKTYYVQDNHLWEADGSSEPRPILTHEIERHKIVQKEDGTFDLYD